MTGRTDRKVQKGETYWELARDVTSMSEHLSGGQNNTSFICQQAIDVIDFCWQHCQILSSCAIGCTKEKTRLDCQKRKWWQFYLQLRDDLCNRALQQMESWPACAMVLQSPVWGTMLIHSFALQGSICDMWLKTINLRHHGDSWLLHQKKSAHSTPTDVPCVREICLGISLPLIFYSPDDWGWKKKITRATIKRRGGGET